MAVVTDWSWRHWARRQPNATALIRDDDVWSWRKLAGEVEKRAAAFSRQGLTEGSGVALRGRNSSEMLLSYLALLQCGARLLPLNPQLPVTQTDVLLPSLDIRFGLCFSDADWPGAIVPLSAAVNDAVDTDPRIAWDQERLATMTLTSGSNGLPKAAVHTFAAHLASAEGVCGLMPYAMGDSWLLSLPLFHVSGQGIVWRWLAAGATLVVRPGRSLDIALRGCTHASLVPTQLWRLLAQGDVPTSLTSVLLGGAMIPLTLTQQAEASGIRCWCGYGLTELASTVCAKRADGRPGVGMPLAGRQIKAVDEEIWLRGDSLASGYWRDGALHPLTDAQGWFHTRDRGCWDGSEWRIMGRLDNQFFSGGEGVQPEDVEAVLLRHPAVEFACVVPVDDAEFGQRPVAVVEMTGEDGLAALRDWLAPQLAGYQRPVAFYRLPEALKNGGIKISRQQVTAWVRRQRG
ncbi:2-succinylbenzoate-CoA ligase [Lonsdalea populi]|uniref:O-succinylbenzoate--CoA ligase n=1 Tax=Lonsdalea populi TaxID=1172565 RepID=A0A3N0ULE6_9GAMM|nr:MULTISPECIES: o-succinylbenzoate--CoA ligase [Lonsdalea]RAT17524.1 2-succinylbenzoate-CoA ligase [Lonsdalea quercina]RAT30069.1 2-succinylbenzoate-CoA ligase [Lonsdalea populi]RAT38003.1 2-succinylbenzoate-CoA ligase [Lonsdalea populi]RAT48442.1 2-succinylbenzoate-CoA ligase [Lonsdalea populi]RAT53433.1 2-succinylbenzoate-CoA ligase [Lonsdalea populi]